jgi:hypothetical protein
MPKRLLIRIEQLKKGAAQAQITPDSITKDNLPLRFSTIQVMAMLVQRRRKTKNEVTFDVIALVLPPLGPTAEEDIPVAPSVAPPDIL